jgi:hypothetical protein
MEFAAGLIVGALTGSFSWLVLAAWLEAQRVRVEGGPQRWNRSGSGRGLERLRQQLSHG